MAAREDGDQPAATHYEVLGLSPAMLDAPAAREPSPLVKQAYRRALLRNHPDKKSGGARPAFTVDQIGLALAVLSSPARRAAYDASLRLSRAAPAPATRLPTGVENADLDDLAFDEAEGRWHRSCRCGNARGYCFDEADLTDAADEGLLMVGCQDCSLWLRVHFAVVDDEGPVASTNSNDGS
ncbi:hypothetical protein CDD83_9615 [Cordyceps sp. RAO-2017]|nr:hypothetical protein CDD83_9615 [Cordyceps sp. RAO-2017]